MDNYKISIVDPKLSVPWDTQVIFMGNRHNKKLT